MGFNFKNSYLTCENVKVKDIQEQVSESPFYLYSFQQIKENYQAYVTALEGIPSIHPDYSFYYMNIQKLIKNYFGLSQMDPLKPTFGEYVYYTNMAGFI